MISITDNEFKKFSGYIKEHYGINLKEEKLSLVTGRLHSILSQKQFNCFSEYYDYVVSDKTGEAVAEMINKITTNHTFFMREPEHFRYFKDSVLPYLKIAIGDRDLRIWSAGCSTGEEPYTLSMIIDEFFGKEKIWWDTKILATDISSKVLNEGIKGIYKKEDISGLPAYWQLSYFKKTENDEYVVNDKIKKEVIFRKLNLMDKVFNFKRKFHVIFCKNVMIYFDNDTKEKLIRKLYGHMEEGAYLFVGLSESLGKYASGFKQVSPSVYRKMQ